MTSVRGVGRLFLAGLFLIYVQPDAQIIETRLLSVISWYYLAFFAISMAVFGMTAGSLVVFTSMRAATADGCSTSSWIGWGFALAGIDSALMIISTVDCPRSGRP